MKKTDRAVSAAFDSEQRFRALVSNLPGAVYRCALDDAWTMEFISDAIEDISGYPASDFVANRVRSFASIIHPDDAGAESIEEAIGSGRPYSLEYRILHRNGDVRWVLERGQATTATDERVLLDGAIFDITDRKRVEDELRAAELRFRSLVEQVPLVIYIDALDELSSNIYTSPQAESILGYSPDEWVADPELFRKILHADDRDRVMSAIAEARRRGERWSGEYRLIARDGRAVWFRDEAVTVRDDAGRPLYSQGYLLDITAQKEAEEVRDRVVAIVESSDDAIFSVTLEGEIVSWNHGAEQIYGYGEEEITGRSVSTLIPPDRAHEVPEILSKIRRGESVTHYETVRLRRDGSEFDASVTVSPVRDARGAIVGASAIQRVITERKRAEEERERLLAAERAARAEAESARQTLAEQNERLKELDRMKDEFVALVSHELRTPLTSIRGYVQLMLTGRGGRVPERQRRFLEVIDRNADRLLRLVSDLLFFGKAGAGSLTLDRRLLRVDELIEEAVQAARPAADERGIALVHAVDAVPPIAGDRARLGQLLDNLLSNALKFTPAGGRVEVTGTAANGDVVVAVADTGMGIPADEKSQVFERFFRASSAARVAVPGTGLGLAIAKAISDAHGGVITIDTEEGVGTTVRLALPALATDAEELLA